MEEAKYDWQTGIVAIMMTTAIILAVLGWLLGLIG